MTARATFRQSELNRAVKVADKNGWMVVVRDGVINLLPRGTETALPSAEQAEAEWDKALGLQ